MDIVSESHQALDADMESMAEHSASRQLARARARERALIEERRHLLVALRELETENAELGALREQLARVRAEFATVRQRSERLDRVHQELVSSLSWRLTSPLRWGIALLRSVLRLSG